MLEVTWNHLVIFASQWVLLFSNETWVFKLPDRNLSRQYHDLLIVVSCIAWHVAHISIIYITTGIDMLLKEWFGNKTNELSVWLELGRAVSQDTLDVCVFAFGVRRPNDDNK